MATELIPELEIFLLRLIEYIEKDICIVTMENCKGSRRISTICRSKYIKVGDSEVYITNCDSEEFNREIMLGRIAARKLFKIVKLFNENAIVASRYPNAVRSEDNCE